MTISQTSTTQTQPALAYISQLNSIDQILEIAINFERSERDFYITLRDKFSGELYELLNILACEEQHHCDLLKRLQTNHELSEFINIHLKRNSTDTVFTSYAQFPDLDKDLSPKDIIKFAIKREDVAMKEYRMLAKRLPDGDIKDAFTFLADEELEHRVELERNYRAL